MAGLVPAIHVFFAVGARDCGDGVQWPKERKPMYFMGIRGVTRIFSLSLLPGNSVYAIYDL